jgi:RNA polymerase sigma-70 factor, ECF subfamily
MDDDLLVARARRGDNAALDRILRDHFDRIYAVCRRLAGNDADAADASQEAMIAIARGISRFDGRSSLSTWMYRVATNACLDELRRRGRRPVAMSDELLGSYVSDSPELASSVSDRLTIDAALAELPEEFRAAVVLRDVLGYDYNQIAHVLGVPAGTVKSRIARGRATLAGRIGNQDGPGKRLSGGHE